MLPEVGGVLVGAANVAVGVSTTTVAASRVIARIIQIPSSWAPGFPVGARQVGLGSFGARVKSGPRPPEVLVVDRFIETIPQCNWPPGDRGNVDALLTKQHGTGDSRNEPHAYRTENVRLHRCPSSFDEKRTRCLREKLFRSGVRGVLETPIE